MSKNIKRFTSTSEYEKWKAVDGWSYPSVCFVESNLESQVYYNNEFVMRWNDGDTAKTPTFLGDISWEDFKIWVDNASLPCEIKKDGSDFAYLNTGDLTKTVGGDASHYGADYPDYLQLAEIANVNVGLFQNSKTGTKEVRFNFDLGCPEGFHKWFAHPYYNADRGCYTKLVGRYNITPSDTVSTAATNGVDCNAGLGMSGTTTPSASATYSKGNWSANSILSGIKNTLTSDAIEAGYDLLSITYWEYVVMSYIFCAYLKTFNVQSIISGLQTDYTNYNGNLLGGIIDTATTYVTGSASTHYAVSTAANTSNSYYKFLWLEMPLHGQQWIWGAGWVGNNGSYYMTYDDQLANKSATMSTDYADIYGTYPTGMSASYISKIDVYGVPTAIGASSSTGFYDGGWSNTSTGRVAWLGGTSGGGAVDGVFARRFDGVASYAYWAWRGRLTMNR